MKILLVEDNEAQSALIAMILRKGRCAAHVDAVDHLAGAVMSLRANKYDAVMLDLGLPDSRGIETLEMIRRATTASMPIIVITGDDRRETMEACAEAGAIDFIAKSKLSEKRILNSVTHARKKGLEAEVYERVAEKMSRGLKELSQRLKVPNADQPLSA